jgi:hypothetical protein
LAAVPALTLSAAAALERRREAAAQAPNFSVAALGQLQEVAAQAPTLLAAALGTRREAELASWLAAESLFDRLAAPRNGRGQSACLRVRAEPSTRERSGRTPMRGTPGPR